MRNTILFVGLLLLVCSIGCGKGYVPLSGTVTFSDDGAPLTKGTVCFENGPNYARGTLDAQGHYVVDYDKPGSGLPKGEYKVYVSDALVEDGTITSIGSTGNYERPKYKSLIDTKFNSAATSGLTCVVDGTTETFDFKVDRAK